MSGAMPLGLYVLILAGFVYISVFEDPVKSSGN